MVRRGNFFGNGTNDNFISMAGGRIYFNYSSQDIDFPYLKIPRVSHIIIDAGTDYHYY